MNASTTQSKALFERALRVIPAGVSSPVRAYGAVGGTPRVIASARGAEITDVDGNTYLDFVGLISQTTWVQSVEELEEHLPRRGGFTKDDGPLHQEHALEVCVAVRARGITRAGGARCGRLLDTDLSLAEYGGNVRCAPDRTKSPDNG